MWSMLTPNFSMAAEYAGTQRDCATVLELVFAQRRRLLRGSFQHQLRAIVILPTLLLNHAAQLFTPQRYFAHDYKQTDTRKDEPTHDSRPKLLLSRHCVILVPWWALEADGANDNAPLLCNGRHLRHNDRGSRSRLIGNSDRNSRWAAQGQSLSSLSSRASRGLGRGHILHAGLSVLNSLGDGIGVLFGLGC